jgi:hypothetical protein
MNLFGFWTHQGEEGLRHTYVPPWRVIDFVRLETVRSENGLRQ